MRPAAGSFSLKFQSVGQQTSLCSIVSCREVGQLKAEEQTLKLAARPLPSSSNGQLGCKILLFKA